MLAAFKLSAVPVNVNLRYVEAELRHLYDDADLLAVVHHRRFSPRVGAVAGDAHAVKHLIVVDDDSGEDIADGALDYEQSLAAASPERPHNPARTGDDRYIAYTGGTTGMRRGFLCGREGSFFPP